MKEWKSSCDITRRVEIQLWHHKAHPAGALLALLLIQTVSGCLGQVDLQGVVLQVQPLQALRGRQKLFQHWGHPSYRPGFRTKWISTAVPTLSWEKLVGRTLSLLLYKSRCWRLLRFPRSSGRQVSWFLLRSTFTRWVRLQNSGCTRENLTLEVLTELVYGHKKKVSVQPKTLKKVFAWTSESAGVPMWCNTVQ